jgi:hypothetical protein
MVITVNGSLCADHGISYVNKPCVEVTVCAPDNSVCRTIDDILLDTGSFGLRVFRDALGVALTSSLPAVGGASGEVAECVQFADGSALWGPVRTASVTLSEEPAVQVPIQVIDNTFFPLRFACLGADANPDVAGFKGLLGVGLLVHDCGTGCAASAANGMYYACSGSSCAGSAVPLASQVQNPAALLPEDNNGVIVRLPSVPPGGAASVNGTLLLGIGTQANNVPSGVTAYPASAFANFTTSLGGENYTGFLDTGSNGIFFTPPATVDLPACPNNIGWFCPPATVSLSAATTGASGSPTGMVDFQIDNALVLFSSSNMVFADLGADVGGGFDWGLPFHLGRDVYIGFEGRSSGLGTGPYWAYGTP